MSQSHELGLFYHLLMPRSSPGTTIFTLPYDKDEKNKNIPAEEPATSKENVEAAVVTNAAIKEEEPSPNVEAKDEEENKSDVCPLQSSDL